MAAIPQTDFSVQSRVAHRMSARGSQTIYHGWRGIQGMEIPFTDAQVFFDAGTHSEWTGVNPQISIEKDHTVDGLPFKRDWERAYFEQAVAEHLEDMISDIDHTFVVGYRNHPMFEQLFEDINRARPGTVDDLTVSSRLWEKLDNKLNFAEGLERCGIPGPKGKTISILPSTTYDALASVYGSKFVIKDATSTGGGFGMAFPSSEAEFEAWKMMSFSERKSVLARVEEYDPGQDASMLAVGFPDGRLLLAPLNVQLVGKPECTPSSAIWCGNDYSVGAFDPRFSEVQREAVKYVKELWEGYLHPEGLIGEFGIDFRIDLDRCRAQPGEVNPRLTGQSMFLTALQRAAGVKPLIMYHLLAHLGESISDEEMDRYNTVSLGTPLRGSMMVSHLLQEHSRGYHQVTGELTPGTYSLEKGRMDYLSDSVDLKDCPPYAFVIPPGPPVRGTVIDDGYKYEIFRVLFPHRAMGNDGELTEYAKSVMSQSYEMLGLREI